MLYARWRLPKWHAALKQRERKARAISAFFCRNLLEISARVPVSPCLPQFHSRETVESVATKCHVVPKRQITARPVVYEAHIAGLAVEKLRGANAVGTNDVSYNRTAIASRERNVCSSPDLATTSGPEKTLMETRTSSIRESTRALRRVWKTRQYRPISSLSIPPSLFSALYSRAFLPRSRRFAENAQRSRFNVETIGNFFNLQSANEQMLSRRWFPDLTRRVKSHRRAPRGWEKPSPSAPPPLRIPAGRGRRNDVSVEISFRMPGRALQQPERLNNWGRLCEAARLRSPSI